MGKLTEGQRKKLVSLLDPCGFELSTQGRIDVKTPLKGHPDWTPEIYHRQGKTFYLPVGFLADSEVNLVNTDQKFPRDYHAQLRALYNLVTLLDPEENTQTRPTPAETH